MDGGRCPDGESDGGEGTGHGNVKLGWIRSENDVLLEKLPGRVELGVAALAGGPTPRSKGLTQGW